MQETPDGRQHGKHDAGRCRTFAHRRPVSVELGRIEVAMGVDPAIHGFIMHQRGARLAGKNARRTPCKNRQSMLP